MATTENNYVGDGSTVLFSFTFPYIEQDDVKVSLDSASTTEYSLANATTVQFNTAPAAGVAIRIFRDTDDDDLAATFYPGSAVRAQDLNDNFTQNLYVTQEISNYSLRTDGSNPLLGDLNLNSNKIINLEAPSAGTDAANKTYVDTKVAKTGDTMTGNLVMSGNTVTGLGQPTAATDSATKQYVDTRYGQLTVPGVTRWRKVATEGQTVFSGVGEYGGTLAYSSSRETVYINGALQQRNVDYTAEDGSSVTFSPGLLAGDVVEVHCVNNAAGITTDQSTGVYYTNPASGAATRTVASKLSDVVSVKDFGAVGDGVTDDTAAIQAALSSGAKAVELSANGAFLVSSTLTLPSGVTLTGNGSGIVCSTHFTVLSATGSNRLQSLRITGPTDGTYTSGSIAIRFAGAKNVGSAPTYAQDLVVENCTITGFGDYGIRLAYAKRVHLSGNTLSSIGYTGIGGTSCEDVSISCNIIKSIGPGTSGDAYGIFVDREDGTSETEDPRSYRCVISGNLIENVVSSGIGGQGIDTHGGVDFVIEGNTVTDCQAGIFLTASSISGTQALGPKRCVVTNNLISSTYFVNYGILLYGARVGAVVNDYCQECVVSDNIVIGHGSQVSETIPAVFVSVTKNCKITDNLIKDSGGNCVLLDYSNITVDVSGNTFVDPHSTSYVTPSCVRVYSSDNRGLIGNNTYRFENAALATYVAVNSVLIDSGLSGLDLDVTRSSFQGIDATHLAFTALTPVRNNGLMTLSGQSTIVVSSGVADGITDVTFATRFPYAPNVTFTLRNPYNQGGKFPIIGIDTVVPVSENGFRIYARPYDGSTWSTTGSLTFDWIAS